MMCRGLLAASGPLWAGGSGFRALAAEGVAAARALPKPKGTAKSVIHIWPGGGPSHLDTFDPKPDAGPDCTGPLNEVIETNVPGIRINATLPLLANMADKYSIIRSFTHPEVGHEGDAVFAVTGRDTRIAFPSFLCVLSALRGYDAGYRGKVPPFVLLTENGGFRPAQLGFLDRKYGPFVTGGDPSKTPFVVEGIVTEGISDTRQKQRRDFLATMDTLGQTMKGDPQWKPLEEARDEAYDMILGEGRKIFDPASEPDAVRDRYGRNKFGQCCLVARKLVQAGAPVVHVNDSARSATENWDTHCPIHFELMKTMLPVLDQGLSALLQDLADHGLLDSTIVYWGAEMGRTPKVSKEFGGGLGRGHWSNCYSVVVAGGGFQGGRVVGESDAQGAFVKSRPVYPCDIIGSIYLLMGISLDTLIPHPRLKYPVYPAPEEGVPCGGVLTEIM
jgi:hypothetical protein